MPVWSHHRLAVVYYFGYVVGSKITLGFFFCVAPSVPSLSISMVMQSCKSLHKNLTQKKFAQRFNFAQVRQKVKVL